MQSNQHQNFTIKYFLTIILVLFCFELFSNNFSGSYAYNKGMNKASGNFYLNHFKEDSAFFMLQTVSGMPDFFTTELKGFIKIENMIGTFVTKDSCMLHFNFTNSSATLTDNVNCKFDFSPAGKYKKTTPILKKGSGFLPAFADKNGLVVSDSIKCYSIPSSSGKVEYVLYKNEKVQISDDFSGFYMIEIKSKKNLFLWVSKKSIQLLKK